MLIIFCVFAIALLIYLIYASAFINSGVYVKAICRLDTNEKLLALTFDDGPDPEITPQILDILAKYNIPAVFFCIGQQIENNEAILKRMIDEGHLIGNHTFTHSPLLPLFFTERMRIEVLVCEGLIESTIEQETPRLYRPPFGVTNPATKKMAASLGYKVMGWSLRSLDTMKKEAQSVVRRVIKKIKPGDIILFHDNLKNAPEILENVIKHALRDGYRFVRADETPQPPKGGADPIPEPAKVASPPFRGLGGLFLGLLLTTTVFAQSDFKALASVDDFKKRLSAESASLKSIESDFTQTKYMEMLSEKIVSKGKFYYRKTDKICLDYVSPVKYLIVINGKKIKITADGKSNTYDVSSNKVMGQMNKLISACMTGNLNDLSTDYKLNFQENGSLYWINVKPQGSVKSYMKAIDIFLDKKDLSVQRLKLTETSADYTEYVFSNKKKNTSIPDEKFLIK